MRDIFNNENDSDSGSESDNEGEVEPTCDHCGRTQDQVSDEDCCLGIGRDVWNGETGCCGVCEEKLGIPAKESDSESESDE